MRNPNVLDQVQHTPQEKWATLKRISFSLALASGCGDSTSSSSTTGAETTTNPTSDSSITEAGSSTTGTGITLGSSETGVTGSISGESMSTTGTESGTTIEPTTSGVSTSETGGTTIMESTNPTGIECMENLNCGPAGKCIQDVCVCNPGAFLTNANGCVDDQCDPNPCPNDQGCNTSESDGTANCIVPAPVILKISPGCAGVDENMCIKGEQTNAYVEVTDAKSCMVLTVNGGTDPGQINTIINNHAEFTYIAPVFATKDKITATCKGGGGMVEASIDVTAE